MKTQATALYPFVPSGPDFALALEFFAALGWRRDPRLIVQPPRVGAFLSAKPRSTLAA